MMAGEPPGWHRLQIGRVHRARGIDRVGVSVGSPSTSRLPCASCSGVRRRPDSASHAERKRVQPGLREERGGDRLQRERSTAATAAPTSFAPSKPPAHPYRYAASPRRRSSPPRRERAGVGDMLGTSTRRRCVRPTRWSSVRRAFGERHRSDRGQLRAARRRRARTRAS